MCVTNGALLGAVQCAMELNRQLAIENLRIAIAEHRIELGRLFVLIDTGATPKIQKEASADLEGVRRLLHAQLNELTKLESQ